MKKTIKYFLREESSLNLFQKNSIQFFVKHIFIDVDKETVRDKGAERRQGT